MSVTGQGKTRIPRSRVLGLILGFVAGMAGLWAGMAVLDMTGIDGDSTHHFAAVLTVMSVAALVLMARFMTRWLGAGLAVFSGTYWVILFLAVEFSRRF